MAYQIKNYREIKGRSTPEQTIAEFYMEECKKYGINSSLFTFCIIDGTDTYVLSKTLQNFKTACKHNLFENINYVNSEMSKYPEGFLFGYDSIISETSRINGDLFVEYVLNCLKSLSGNPLEPVFIDENKKVFPDDWRNYGAMIGRYYAAICLILEHQGMFKARLGNSKTEIEKDWKPLYNEFINKYFVGVSENDFQIVMNEQWLPKNIKNIVWIGTRSEGYHFSKYFNFKLPVFNKCFIGDNGKHFRHNDKEQIKQDYEDLLKKF